MKTKLHIITAVLVASVGFALFANVSPAAASGEKYKWIDANTIQGDGGGIDPTTEAQNNGNIKFKKQGGVYVGVSKGSACTVTITLKPSLDNKSASITHKGCDSYDNIKNLDKTTTIANPEKGPPLPGSDINYTTVDCSTYSGLEKNRCDGVQQCIKESKKGKSECLSAWTSCQQSFGDSFSGDAQTFCKTKVGEGKFDEAKKPAGADDKTTCAVEGIGWIVCPVTKFLAQIVDAAYSFVTSLLTVQPLLTTGDQKGIYDAWSIMRNFANVAFVIAFMIIIFSQVTSVGVSNYGIKRMLPRLIIAAILVNVSYWICAIAVDVSNILGGSVKGLFSSIKDGLAVPNASEISSSATGEGWTGIAGAVLAGGLLGAAALYIGLSALLPALIAALLAIVTVFLVLTLRQALILLLVVISPLAFVAYLLPNTESLFTKWRGLFQTLLLMYPIIALIFGTSALASQIVMNTADDTAVKIMGALIAIIPLAITPMVMKSAGGVLNRFGGFINNPNKGPFDRMRKGADGYRKNRQMLRDTRALNGGRRFGGGLVRSRARRNAVIASREGGLKDATTNYVANQAASNNGDNLFARQMAGGGYVTKGNAAAQTAVVASALAQQKKAFAEDVSNMEALVKVKFKNPREALEQALETGDKVQAVAAQNLLFKSGGSGVSAFREVVQNAEASGGAGAQNLGAEGGVGDSLRSNVTENHGQYAKQKGADIVQWAASEQGPAGEPKKSLSEATAGTLSDNDLASQHAGSIGKSVDQGNVSSEQATRMLNDPRVSANLDDKQKGHLQRAAADTRVHNVDEAHAQAIGENRNRDHEDALVQNALHDMNRRDPNNP